jgi:hypothetical protein
LGLSDVPFLSSFNKIYSAPTFIRNSYPLNSFTKTSLPDNIITNVIRGNTNST